MQFLKTLFWVVLAAVLVLWARANWTPVELTLWGGLVADIKLPVLILVAFLLGFLPTYILYRSRLWSLKRRLEPTERGTVSVPVAPSAPVPVSNSPGGHDISRSATDPTAPTLR
jgi:uncharacterized integral membrane protein